MQRVLQINGDYFGTALFQRLCDSLHRLNVDSQVFVALQEGFPLPASVPGNVAAETCFHSLDRVLFFSKQKKMLRAMESRWNISDFDVINAHSLFSGGYSALQLHKKYRIPYIVVVTNTDKNVFFRRMPHLRRIGVEIMAQAAYVIFTTPPYLDFLLKHYIPESMRTMIQDKSVNIPFGISDVFYQGRTLPHDLPQGGSLRILQVGEVNDNKNVKTTIEAVRLLREEGIPAVLSVVGKISQKHYEGYFDQFPFVTYLGKQPPEKVRDAMRQSDLFVLPSHTESFGLVYPEAMSQGLPILYTRGEGFDGHFPDGTVGYAVDDRSAQDVAEKIKLAAAHYTELSRNAYEKSALFSWDMVGKRYKDLYEAALRETECAKTKR